MLTKYSRQGSQRPLLKSITAPNKTDQAVHKLGLGLAAADSINLSLIFILKQYFAEALAGLGHTIVFPFAAGASLIQASIALYQAKKEGYKKRGVLKAVVEGVGALAVVTAVVGSFIAATLFATVAPLIFTVVSAAKTLYLAGSAAYYGVKSYLVTAQDKKEKYKNMALAFGVGAFINALATVAIGLVMVAGKISFGVLGVIAGAIGAAYTAYQAVAARKPATEKSSEGENQSKISSTSRLYKALGLRRSHSMSEIQVREKQDRAVHHPLTNIELNNANNLRASVDESAVVLPKLTRSFSF